MNNQESTDNFDIKCTLCAEVIKNKKLFIHPDLKLILCKNCCYTRRKCKRFKNEKDEGDTCFLCGLKNGDLMMLCDVCNYAFHKRCLKNIVSKEYYNEVDYVDKWACLRCDSSLIEEARKLSDMHKERIIELPTAAPTSNKLSPVDAVEKCLTNSLYGAVKLRDTISQCKQKLKNWKNLKDLQHIMSIMRESLTDNNVFNTNVLNVIMSIEEKLKKACHSQELINNNHPIKAAEEKAQIMELAIPNREADESTNDYSINQYRANGNNCKPVDSNEQIVGEVGQKQLNTEVNVEKITRADSIKTPEETTKSESCEKSKLSLKKSKRHKTYHLNNSGESSENEEFAIQKSTGSINVKQVMEASNEWTDNEMEELQREIDNWSARIETEKCDVESAVRKEDMQLKNKNDLNSTAELLKILEDNSDTSCCSSESSTSKQSNTSWNIKHEFGFKDRMFRRFAFPSTSSDDEQQSHGNNAVEFLVKSDKKLQQNVQVEVKKMSSEDINYILKSGVRRYNWRQNQ